MHSALRIKEELLKNFCLLLIICYLFFNGLARKFADASESCSDSHVPIGVMGDHGHKIGELMCSYRFMAMDMQGLQSDTTSVEIAAVLKDFMMAPHYYANADAHGRDHVCAA